MVWILFWILYCFFLGTENKKSGMPGLECQWRIQIPQDLLATVFQFVNLTNRHCQWWPAFHLPNSNKTYLVTCTTLCNVQSQQNQRNRCILKKVRNLSFFAAGIETKALVQIGRSQRQHSAWSPCPGTPRSNHAWTAIEWRQVETDSNACAIMCLWNLVEPT